MCVKRFNAVDQKCRCGITARDRLRGSASQCASPVLTATHHSYRSRRLSDFFSGSPLEVRPPTDFEAKWLKRRAFTQRKDVTFAVKIATFHNP